MKAIGHLLNGTLETLKFLEQPKRLYYVNLNDISAIEKTKFYIACTSEKVDNKLSGVENGANHETKYLFV